MKLNLNCKKKLTLTFLLCTGLFFTRTLLSRQMIVFNKIFSMHESQRRIVEPCKVSSYEQIRSIFLSPDRELCPLQEVWGGQIYSFNFQEETGTKIVRRLSGNYVVCMEKGIAPLKNDCLVYSFGINIDWSFDKTAEDFGCEVYSYDPSIGLPARDLPVRIFFNDTGLSNIDGTIKRNEQLWKMARFSSLLREKNHTHRKLDILKIDIEGSEHEAIPDMLQSGSLLNVRQILLEIHNFAGLSLEKYYSIFWLLHDYGFASVAAEDWPHVSCVRGSKEGRYETYCYVFTLINKRFLVW